MADGVIMSPRRRAQPVNLRDLGLYNILLDFSRTHWVHLTISDDFSTCPAGSTILSGANSTKSFPYIFKDGTRYGCSNSIIQTTGTSTGDHFACIDMDAGRHPCKILHHLLVTVPGEAPLHCCVIQRMLADDDIPTVPWDL